MQITIGKHSGVHGVEVTLNKYGVSAPRDELVKVLAMVRRAEDEGKSLGEAEVLAMVIKVRNGN
jgi:isopropylmalate/homocitrate/citramalate synthase